jgi:hypothetical protein
MVLNRGAQADARGATKVLNRGGQAVARGSCLSQIFNRNSVFKVPILGFDPPYL